MIKVSLTLFTSDKDTVAKGYDIRGNKLTKVPAENFYNGEYRTLNLKPEELLGFIKSRKQGEFITAGVHQTLSSGKCPRDACRTIDDFKFPLGAGLLIIDCDSLSTYGISTVNECIKKLRSLDVALKSALIVSSPSASSGIIFKGTSSGLRGLHLFCVVDDAKAIPTILEILHKRSVLAGIVRPQITANGIVLVKSMIDQAMKSPNQPCFEGGARILNSAIKQNRTIKSHGKGIVRASDITPLTKEEEANYLECCENVKQSVQAESDAKRSEWLESREADLVKKGVAPERAKLLLNKALDGGVLSGEVEISTDKFGVVTVAEILANPAKYHEQTCADPVDPEYGQCKAKIYSSQDKPCINSLAHGLGTVYFLQDTEYTRDELFGMIEATDDFDELTGRVARLISISNLRDTERDKLQRALSKKAKVSLASIKSDAKIHYNRSNINEFDHLSTAHSVINYFGKENLIFVNGFMYVWRGDGVWCICDDRDIKKVIHITGITPKLTASDINSILDMVKTELHVRKHTFDLNPKSINCVNGELVYKDGQWVLEPHCREHFRTTMIPTAYDSRAKAERFEQFLNEIFKGDPDVDEKIAVVKQALGYSLIPSCRFEKFFMLIGAGANGKSVLLNVLAELVGREYTTAVQPSQFENRFQRGHLKGKLANIITEIAVGAEISDAQLKALVSGEMTTAEHKHKDPFDFIPQAKHWFGTNHMPHTRDFSEALFRRAILISFNNKFVGNNQDVHLMEKLMAELPGILNFALEGLSQLLNNNAFTIPASSARDIAQWKSESNQVAQFVEDDCETGPSLTITTADLYQSYKFWADEAGIRHTLNRNNFTSRIVALGCTLKRGAGGVRMVSGIAKRNNNPRLVSAIPRAQIKKCG